MNERRIALDILTRIEKDKGFSNLVLDAALDGLGLPPQTRALVTALVYGVVENRLSIDYIIGQFSKNGLSGIKPIIRNILRLGVQQILFMDKIPNSAAVNEAVKLAKETGNGFAGGFVNAVLRQIIRQGDKLPMPDQEKQPADYYSVRYSCPKWLIEKWVREYGKETTEGILESLKKRPPAVAKVNLLRTKPEILIGMLEQEGVPAKQSVVFEDALELSSLPDIRKLASFRSGLFHMQDYASQYCCRALGAEPGETVLDLCAAPGGKSFTLAEQMKNQGVVRSCELYQNRLGLISEGADRLGLTCIRPTQNDASVPNPELGPVDRVLCDVPCSGLGVIRRKPEIRYKAPETFSGLPSIQYKILCEGASHVIPGGILVYSTCTLSRAENDEVVDRFLSEHGEFEPSQLPFFNDTKGRITMFPQIHHTDGFFIARFLRKGNNAPRGFIRTEGKAKERINPDKWKKQT